MASRFYMDKQITLCGALYYNYFMKFGDFTNFSKSLRSHNSWKHRDITVACIVYASCLVFWEFISQKLTKAKNSDLFAGTNTRRISTSRQRPWDTQYWPAHSLLLTVNQTFSLTLVHLLFTLSTGPWARQWILLLFSHCKALRIDAVIFH